MDALASVLPAIAGALRVPAADLRPVASSRDDIGMTHVRLSQHKNGMRVVGGEVTLHIGADGVVRSVTSSARDRALDASPAISAAAAAQLAVSNTGATAAATAAATATAAAAAGHRAGLRCLRPRPRSPPRLAGPGRLPPPAPHSSTTSSMSTPLRALSSTATRRIHPVPHPYHPRWPGPHLSARHLHGDRHRGQPAGYRHDRPRGL